LKLDARNRYIVHINPQAAGYKADQLDALCHEMEERFHAIPGVVKVGITSYTPMEDNNNGWGWSAQGLPNVSHGASFSPGESGVLRFGRDKGADGTRRGNRGHADGSAGCG